MTPTSALRRLLTLAVATCLLAMATPAAAQRRVRLSTDLAEKLARGDQDIDVIIEGSRGEVDAVAGRYNLRVKRYLRSGAVLRVNAGQLDALQADPDKDGVYGDDDKCPNSDGQGSLNGCPGGIIPDPPKPDVLTGILTGVKKGATLKKKALAKGLVVKYTCTVDSAAKGSLTITKKTAAVRPTAVRTSTALRIAGGM